METYVSELIRQAPSLAVLTFLVIKFLDHQTRNNDKIRRSLDRNTKTMHGLALVLFSMSGKEHLASVIEELDDDDDEEELEETRKAKR